MDLILTARKRGKKGGFISTIGKLVVLPEVEKSDVDVIYESVKELDSCIVAKKATMVRKLRRIYCDPSSTKEGWNQEDGLYYSLIKGYNAFDLYKPL